MAAAPWETTAPDAALGSRPTDGILDGAADPANPGCRHRLPGGIGQTFGKDRV